MINRRITLQVTHQYPWGIIIFIDVSRIHTVVKEFRWNCFVRFRLCQLATIGIQVVTKN